MIKYNEQEAAAIKQRWQDGVPNLSDNYDFYVLATRRARLAVIDFINRNMTYTAYACNPEEKVRLVWCERTEERTCLHYQACYWIVGLRGTFTADITAGSNQASVVFEREQKYDVINENLQTEEKQ